MTGGGLGLDMLLSCSSCAGSGLGLDMSLSCSSCAGNSIGWSHGMDGVGILGADSTDGGGWLMMIVGGIIGEGGSFEKGSKNLGGL